ncbi:MAG TPA: DUF3828 domain-containing protein [Devosia sp.]|nr:DUF3828 domain-containing protein [Devosia sp.]
MGRALVVAMIVLGWIVPALAAPVFDNPKALIEFAYVPYLHEDQPFPDDPTEIFSPTLKQLWDEMSAKSEASEVPILDFDPIIDAQDYDITDLVIADPVVNGDAAIVAVSFSNMGAPHELHFELIRRTDGWKIDDIESIGENGWRLSELLAADPLLN